MQWEGTSPWLRCRGIVRMAIMGLPLLIGQSSGAAYRASVSAEYVHQVVRSALGVDATIAEFRGPAYLTGNIRGKAETTRGAFDVVTSRAVAPLPKLLPMVRHLIKSGGSLLAIKGESAQSEIDSTPLNKQRALLHTLELPDFEVARVIEVQKA